MDTDKQTLGVLRAFADILAAGSAAQTPVLLGMFPGLVAACRSASDAVYEDVVDTLELVAGRPEFRDVMLKERVPEFLRDMRPVLEDYGADDALAKLDRTLAALNGSSSSSSSSNSSAAAKDTAAAPAAAKRAVATLQVTMDNLLGVRAVEDRYIRAMLGVDGVTSVTLDRKRDVGLVYHHAGDDAQALKAQLYEIIQTVCDEVQDEAGKPRFVVRGDHAAYLEDDDDDGEDFFSSASGGTLTRAGGAEVEESADEVARKRDEAMKAQGGGWFSWLRW